MIKEIKELLETEWQMNHQLETSGFTEQEIRVYNVQNKGEFIHYLQDQFNKITKGLEW